MWFIFLFLVMFSLRMVFSMILSTDVLFPIIIGNLSTFICSETVLNLHSGKFIQLVVVTPGKMKFGFADNFEIKCTF